jgi:hypothetical protein
MAAEQLRRQLLKDSGITCWFPRGVLTGAAPSHRVCIDMVEAVSSPVNVPPATSLSPVSPVVPVAAPMR